MTIEELIETQTHYDLGNRWTIGKKPLGWVIYFKGISFDVREQNYNKQRLSDEPSYYVTVPDALAKWESIKNAPWAQ